MAKLPHVHLKASNTIGMVLEESIQDSESIIPGSLVTPKSSA